VHNIAPEEEKRPAGHGDEHVDTLRPVVVPM
jgi:hypothetical protein